MGLYFFHIGISHIRLREFISYILIDQSIIMIKSKSLQSLFVPTLWGVVFCVTHIFVGHDEDNYYIIYEMRKKVSCAR